MWSFLWILLVAATVQGATDYCQDGKHKSSAFCRTTWGGLMAIARMNPKESPEEAPSRTRNASFFGLKWPFHKHEQTQQSVFTPIPVANNTLERYKALARLQYIAYCPTGINTWNCGICSDKASPLKNTTLGVQFSNSAQTVFGIVGVSHDLERIFVAFQGALKARQWARCYEMAMRRPDALGVKDKNVFVHFGFYKSYMEIRPLVINLLLERRAQYPLYKFLVLGHSYGGGVSGIMALDFASGLLGNLIAPRFVEWVTFGSPRVGNHEYARAMNRAPWVNQARLVHSTDIVAHTPAKVKQLGMDYLHPAGEIWLDPTSTDWMQCDDPSVARSPSYTESKKCSNSIPLRKYSIIAHLSYTTKRAFDVCPYDPMSMNVPVSFLPDYTVSD